MYWNGTVRKSAQLKLVTLAAMAVLQVCLSLPAQSQTQTQEPPGERISVPLSDGSRPALVKASLVTGGIKVKGYDGKQVVVEAQGEDKEGLGRDSEGPWLGREGRRLNKDSNMKRIPMMASGLSVEEENNRVHIRVDSVHRPVGLNIMVPVRSSLILRTVNGDISVEGVEGELDVDDVNGSVTLSGVSGTAVAHSLNGRVLATFNRLNREKPMAFSSLNGDIDVAFPADLKANIMLSSDHGEVYCDFDVQLQKGGPQPMVEDSRGRGGKYRVRMDKAVRGTINGGGQEIKFKNVQGNIYIRKASK